MKASIYIPNELEEAVQRYLKDHPEMTLSSLVQDALEMKIRPRPNRILDLLGFADSRDTPPRTPEQIAEDKRERPEDEAARQDRL